MGKPDEAEQVFRRLMQSNPERVVVFVNLAAVLSGQKRYPEAEAVARQAMKPKPSCNTRKSNMRRPGRCWIIGRKSRAQSSIPLGLRAAR